MEVAGLPLHPLVVHATVVFVPLSAIASAAFAMVPRWRWLLRWPTWLLAVGATLAAWVARLSGNALLEDRPELRPLVRVHQDRGELLTLVVLGYLVLVLFGAWSLSGTSPLASGRGAREAQVPALERVLPVLVVLAALVVLVLVVLTGDAGSRAVWG
jgi:uncharacterized membrane protein